MTSFFAAAWAISRVLSVAALLLAVAGVIIFGWNFVKLSARAGQRESRDIPSQAWAGRQAKIAYWIVGSGAVLLLTAIILANILPTQF
jgi:hypothetical protein